MKISVDDKECFSLSEVQKKVICNDIHQDEFEDDMRRRLNYILIHKYDQCFDRLKKEWEPRLIQRFSSIPTNPDKLAELIFSQPDYKCKKARENERQKI